MKRPSNATLAAIVACLLLLFIAGAMAATFLPPQAYARFSAMAIGVVLAGLGGIVLIAGFLPPNEPK